MSEAGVQSPTGGSPKPQEFTENFDFYVRFAKPLVLNLSAPNERVLAAAWVQKLSDTATGDEKTRTDYLKLLLFVLQKGRLFGPFARNPATVELDDLGMRLIDVAKCWLETEENLKKRRFILGLSSEYPVINAECSGDLKEYAASQDIPNFGIHAYYAFSNDPITEWNNIEKGIFPKGALSAIKKADSLSAVSEHTRKSRTKSKEKSVEAIIKGRSKSKTRSRSASRSRVEGVKGSAGDMTDQSFKKVSFGPDDEKSRLKTFPKSSSPLGSPLPAETRSPPTWGSNLISVSDPPPAEGVLATSFDDTELKCPSKDIFQVTSKRDLFGAMPPEDRSPIFYESSPSYHDVSDIEIPPLRKPSTPTPPRPKRPYDSAEFIRRRKIIRRPFDSAPRLKYNEWGLPVQDLTPMSAPSLPYLTPPRFYDEAPSLPYLTPPQYYDEAPSLPYLTPPGRPPSSSDEVDEAMRKINEQYQQLFSPPEKSDSPVAETAEDIEMKRRLDARAALLAQRRVQMLAQQQQQQQAAALQAPTTCADQELSEFEQLEAQLGIQPTRPRTPSSAERRATEMAMRQAEIRAQQQFRTLEPCQIEHEPRVRRRSPPRQSPTCIDPDLAEFEQMEAQLGIRPPTSSRLPTLAERRSSRTMLRRIESRARKQMRSLQPQVQITDQTIRQVVAEETPVVSEQAQAIVEEAMEDLAQAVEPEQTLEEMYAEQDLRYPDRRGDVPRTPPVFSKVVKIREGPGRKLTYAAAEFGLSEDEQFVPGPEFMRGRTALSPRVDEREILRRTREPFDIFDLAAEADDILNVDDIEAILVPSPKSRSLERSLREATTSNLQQAMENIPALGGVPATIPTKSPLPLRSPDNLYFEDAPSFLSPCVTPEEQSMPCLSPQAPRLPSPGRVSPVRSPRRTSPVRTSPIRTSPVRTSPALRQTSPMRLEYVPYADPCPEAAALMEKYQSPPPPREPTPPPRQVTPPKPKRKVLRLPARARPKKMLKPTKPVPVPKAPEPAQPAPKTPPKRIEKTLQEKVAEMHEQFQDLYSSLVEDEDDTCHGGMTPQGRPSPYFSPTTPPRRRSPTRTPPRATIPDVFELPYSPGWGGEPEFVDDYSICSPQAFEPAEDNFFFTETELTYASPPPLTPEEVQPQVTVVPCGRSPSQPQQLALPSPRPRSPPQQLALPAPVPCGRQSFTPPPPITAPASAPHVVASVTSVTSITVTPPQARSPLQTMEERQYAASFADPEQAALMQRVLKVVKTVPGHSPICPDNFFEQYEGQDVNIVDTPPDLIHDLDFPDATPDQSFDFRDFAPSPEIKDSRIVATIQSQEAELGIVPCQAAAPTQAVICTPDDSFERLEYEAYKEAQEEAMQAGRQIEAPPRYMRPPDIFDFVAGMPTEGIGGGLYDIEQPEDFGDQEVLSPARTPPCSPQDHIIYEGDAPEYYSPEMVTTEQVQEVEVRYTPPPPPQLELPGEPERICVSPQQVSPVTQGVCPGVAQPQRRPSRQSFRPSYPEISPDQGPIDEVLFKSRILMAESPEYRESMTVRPGSIKGRTRVVRRGARPMLHPDIPEEGEGSYGRPTLRPRPRRQREYQPCGAYQPPTGPETAAAQIAAEEQRRAQILYTPTRAAPAATAAPARRRRKPTRKGRKIDFGAVAEAEWYSNFPPEIQEAVIQHGLSPPTPEGLPENLLGDGGVGQFYAPRGLMDMSIDENLPKPMSPEEYYGVVPFRRRRASPKPAPKVLSPWRPGLLGQGQDLLICTQPVDFAGSPEMASIPDEYESPEGLQTAAPCLGGYVPITPPPAVSPLQPSPKRVFGPQRPSPGYKTPPRRLPPAAIIAANKQYQDLLRDSPPDDLPPCAMGAPCGAAEVVRPSTPPLPMLGAGSPRTPRRTPPTFYQGIGTANIYEDDPCLVPPSPPSPMTQMRQAVAQAVGRSGIKRTRPRRRLSAPRLSRIEQEDEVITPSPRMATPPPRMATPPLRAPTPPPCGPAPVYGPPTYSEYLQEMVTEVNADIFDDDGVHPTISPPTQLDLQWQLLKDQMQVMGGIDDFEDMAQFALSPRTPSPQARPPTPPTPPTPPSSPRRRYSPDFPCDVRSPIDVLGSPEFIGSPEDPFNEAFQGYSPPGYEGPITPPRMASPKTPSPKIASPVQPIPAAYPCADPRLSPPVRYRSPSPPPGSPEFRRRVEQHVPASYKRKRRRPPPRIMSPVLEGLTPQYESPVRSPLRPRSSPRYSSSPESSPRDIFNEQIRFSDIGSFFDMNEPSFIGSPDAPSPGYYPMGEIFDAEDITQGYSSPEPCVPEEVLYFTPPEFPQSPCRPAVCSPARSSARSPARSPVRSPVRSSAPIRSPIRQPMPVAPIVQTPPRARTPPQVARIPSPRSATPPPAPRIPSPRARTPPMIVPCGSPGPSPDFMERVRQHQPVRRRRPKRMRQPGIMESITEITQVERTPGLPAVFQRSSQIIFTPRQVSPPTPSWARSPEAPLPPLPDWLEDVEPPDDYEHTPPCSAPCNAVLDTSPIPEDQPTSNFDWLC